MKNILAGTQRLLAGHTAKKEPITAFQLEQLVACKADSMTSLYNYRSVVICLLAFAAFRRFDELPKLVRSDVKSKMTCGAHHSCRKCWLARPAF